MIKLINNAQDQSANFSLDAKISTSKPRKKKTDATTPVNAQVSLFNLKKE